MGQVDPVHHRQVEAVEYAKDHGNDIVILDTAGRLHIDEQLMDELKRDQGGGRSPTRSCWSWTP